jgi:outer membrane protein OmpA-like peptidoglycan-associated protein
MNGVETGLPTGRTLSFYGRRAFAVVAGLALGVAALGLSTSAEAQQRTFYLDRLNLGGAPDDAVGLWRPQMGEKTRFYGQLGLGFSLNPFRLENEIHDERERTLARQKGVATPVSAQLIGYADVGVEILDRFAFQVEFPLTIYQATNPTIFQSKTTVSAEPTAANDLRLDGRVIVLRSDSRLFKAGVNGSVWVPTGNSMSYGGYGSAHGALGLSLELDPKTVFFVLNTGVHFSGGGGVRDFQVEHEWTYGGGVFLPLRNNTVRLGAQIFGSAPIGKGDIGPNTPLEWMAEGRMALGEKKQTYIGVAGGTRITSGYSPDFRAFAMVGTWFGIENTDPKSPAKRYKTERYADHGADTDKDGIPDDMDLCPTVPEDHKPPNTDDGCPALPDRDGDGIPDIHDKCPDEPEDFDGIQDLDGCPEDDADKDGIADAEDACPKEPGEPSTEPAKNGCPQFIRRISGSSEIQILKQVQFATAKATILPNSYSILDEVVRLLKVNPDIAHLGVEGHTDNRGSIAMNEGLSQDRADSVMKYLVDHGIDAGRLQAKGFGPARPIADNNTAAGRQTNRRVEFHIRNQGGEAPAAAPDPSQGTVTPP